MTELEQGLDQIDVAEKQADEGGFFLIETDFVVESIGLGSNLPQDIDALNLVNDETGILTLFTTDEKAGEIIAKLDKNGIGITGANFDPDLYRSETILPQD